MIESKFSANGAPALDSHEAHLQAKQFMDVVGRTLTTSYAEWAGKNSWSEVDVPGPVVVPSPGRVLKQGNDVPGVVDFKAYRDLCADYGHNKRDFKRLLHEGIGTAVQQTAWAELSPTYSVVGDTSSFHSSRDSLFTGQPLVFSGRQPTGLLGELTLTHLGEGDKEGYLKLHNARARCAKVVATTFRQPLDVIREGSIEDTEKLSRAIGVPDKKPYRRDIYNPLFHTALEGMMSVGQTVNFLVQPGIEGAEHLDVVDRSKEILSANIPVTFSRLVFTGDLSPNQMAGFAQGGLVERTETGMRLKPDVVKALRDRQLAFIKDDSEKAGKDKEPDPGTSVVNRGEGCPAGKAVRLMSQMLIDALNAEEGNSTTSFPASVQNRKRLVLFPR